MRNLLTEFRRGAAADWPILASLLLMWIVLLALLALNDINGISLASYRLNLTLYVAALFVAGILAGGTLLVRYRPEKPIGFMAASFVSSGFASRLISGIPMLVALVVFLPLFSKMKSAIPLFNSYTWDNTWAGLDRAIHGVDAWQVLQPVFGYPLLTSMLSIFYHSWIPLIYLVAVYFCFFQSNRVLRARFFIAYFGCWTILGVAMATAFASVGPCFTGVLLGDHRFDEQMEYLRGANEVYPVLVLSVQESLASAFQSGGSGLGSGITAMPSMHVSLAFLFFLAMREVSKFAGLFFGIFFLIILIGSVHLAYHYAVDGYVSIAATLLIWWASGPLVRKVAKRSGEA